MKLKTRQHKTRSNFIPAIIIAVVITGLSVISNVRQAGAPATDLPSEANPAIPGQAISFSPPGSAANTRRVLFETSATSVHSVAQWLVTIIRDRREPNPQVANNSGTNCILLKHPSAGRAIPATLS